MTRSSLICWFFVVTCLNIALTAENSDDDYQHSSVRARALGRAYSVSSCNYKLQVGYSCLTCHRALHCYPGDIAILVDCAGMFRFCRDGRCSRFQGDKCLPDTKLTTPGPTNYTYTGVSENIAAASPDSANSVVTKKADTMTQKNAGIVTEKLAGTMTKKVAENAFNTQGVTETIIIPIDDTMSTENNSSLTKSVAVNDNVV